MTYCHPQAQPRGKHTGFVLGLLSSDPARRPASRTDQGPDTRGPGCREGRRGRQGPLAAVISRCGLPPRQPLITRLLMRPAAVCNHSGPRRAAREAVGESIPPLGRGRRLQPGTARSAGRRQGCAREASALQCAPGSVSLRNHYHPTLQMRKGAEARKGELRRKTHAEIV